MYMNRYFLIVNCGTFVRSQFVRQYPCHLVEAEMYVANERYRAAIEEMVWPAGPPIIYLDNGAHHNRPYNFDEYWSVVNAVQPHCVVLPDIVGEHHIKSRHRSCEFARRVERAFPYMQMMYVPQGRDRHEVFDEFMYAIGFMDPARYIIGFGQSYLQYERPESNWLDENARMELMDAVLPAALPDTRFHVLGGRWNPADMSRYFNNYNFTGLDSWKPCVCAAYGLQYPQRPSMDAGPFERTSSKVVDDVLLAANVAEFTRAYGLRAAI